MEDIRGLRERVKYRLKKQKNQKFQKNQKIPKKPKKPKYQNPTAFLFQQFPLTYSNELSKRPYPVYTILIQNYLFYLNGIKTYWRYTPVILFNQIQFFHHKIVFFQFSTS